MESDSYLTISDPVQGLFKDRKSRFVSLAFPVTAEDEIKEIIKKIKKEYYDAAHHCYAYVLGAKGELYRSNDDGEPAAGAPILGQINSRKLTNILVVVVRYFGGIKLGVPGLINAFRTSTSDALDKARIITEYEKATIEINFLYPQMNAVMGILKDDGIEIKEQTFEEKCKIVANVRARIISKISFELEKTEDVKIQKIN